MNIVVNVVQNSSRSTEAVWAEALDHVNNVKPIISEAAAGRGDPPPVPRGRAGEKGHSVSLFCHNSCLREFSEAEILTLRGRQGYGNAPCTMEPCERLAAIAQRNVAQP
jgi:hypothetical protein